MIWDDTGFLLSKNRYNENSLIAEIYTENYGKISGIIFGGTSKKIKNYLQIGNKLYVNYNSKSENRIGYFKIEIIEALSPFYFDNNKKHYISRSLTEKKIVPNFLVDRNHSFVDIKTLLIGLKIISDYLEKSILKPNNLNQPKSRLEFIDTLK